jgi:spastin
MSYMSISLFLALLSSSNSIRRLPKRIYVPLPDNESRKALISHLLKKQGPSASHLLQDRELSRIVQLTEGYSGSDLAALCQEAALGPIRELNPQLLRTIKAEEIRSISVQDFQTALRVIRPSVSQDSLQNFVKWSDQFGVTR